MEEEGAGGSGSGRRGIRRGIFNNLGPRVKKNRSGRALRCPMPGCDYQPKRGNYYVINHLATAHFRKPILDRWCAEGDSWAECGICGKRFGATKGARTSLARHVGNVHDKVYELVSPEVRKKIM